jgi:hypothetical protein
VVGELNCPNLEWLAGKSAKFTSAVTNSLFFK